MTTKTQDDFIRYWAAAGAYYLMLIAFYIDIGQDMGACYFLPWFLPVTGALVLTMYGMRIPLFSRENLANLLPGLAWCITFPWLYTLTYQEYWFMSKICIDFLIGTGLFILLTSLEALLLRFCPRHLTAMAMAVLDFVCILVPLIQVSYYIMVWHCLSPASLMALYLTNPRESVDFLESNVGYVNLALVAVGILLFIALAYRGHLGFSKRLLKKPADDERTGTLILLVIMTLYAVPIWLLPQTSIASLWHDVETYVAETQEYGLSREERLAEMVLDLEEVLPAKAPGTVIVVIGESASRDYMKVYTSDFPYENTPWLSEQVAENPDFILFRNAYSSWSQTVPTLERALTEKSQYNDKAFYESLSIIDVARKAGYETYWFSNQGRYGEYDSAITMVAKTADHAEWTDDSYLFTDKYDEALLTFLPQVNPEANNFIVFHIMGSHIYYYNRYPSEYDEWSDEGGKTIASYANSIHYTDHILAEIFNYAVENLNLTAFVYFSDHGENLDISHNPDVFSFDMVRIPFFIYLSPDYQEALPERTEVLSAHHSRYFTNDMMYDTICGLLNAPSARYDSRQDLTVDDYAFNKQNLTTMLGQRKLTEDPDAGDESFF